MIKKTAESPGLRAGLLLLLLLLGGGAQPVAAQGLEKLPPDFTPPPFDQYFKQRVTELSDPGWLEEITPGNWPEKHKAMRQELQEMLGLNPWPERTPLKPVLTGKVPGEGYTVEKLYFEPMPGLYIGANLYLPAEPKTPLPAILYMCGHSNVTDGEVRIGNKAGYQHHGAWFARHGYVCLIPDTIQWGEIPGEHHGTNRLGRWWWAARGYTPAGVEAWVGIRALDYLETRPEVDRTRFGMTGRSGGGAYSWWVGALDDRIKVAVPVAGITTLHDHVVEGAIEGHCDCMFMVNSKRWDFDRVAALLAPRPLLISNTDSDEIFPLTGVMEVFNRTRRLYRKLGVEANIGIHIAEGPHKDTQPLNAGAFNWLNRFLKGGDRMDLIDEPARRRHEVRELKVFNAIPADEKVTTVDEFFVPAFSSPPLPGLAADWPGQRNAWMKALREEVFGAWPGEAKPSVTMHPEQVKDGFRLTRMDVTTQHPFVLPAWILQRADLKPEQVRGITFQVLDEAAWVEFHQWEAGHFRAGAEEGAGDGAAFLREQAARLDSSHAMAFFCPRGVGPTGLVALSKVKQTHLLRRFLLLGESLESGQVWDIRQAVGALRSLPAWSHQPLSLRSGQVMGANTLYASLYLAGLSRLELENLPASHRAGPTYLNVLRYLDLPQALAMAAAHTPVTLYTGDPTPWCDAQALMMALGMKDRLQILRPE
ncbi:MAG: dienelactone hydrolase family protein [Verrucomicrobiota bacterium]